MAFGDQSGLGRPIPPVVNAMRSCVRGSNCVLCSSAISAVVSLVTPVSTAAGAVDHGGNDFFTVVRLRSPGFGHHPR